MKKSFIPRGLVSLTNDQTGVNCSGNCFYRTDTDMNGIMAGTDWIFVCIPECKLK